MKDKVYFYSDASLSGWGAHDGESTYMGVWDEGDALRHINYLELKAVRMVL
jgi:hypothetical protein